MGKDGKQDKLETRKKVFEPPALERLGSFEEITKGPKTGSIDGLFGAPGGFQS